MNPSPRAHVYRLVALLVIGIAGFVGIKILATPAGWDHERSFRPAAEEELKALPMRFGGNESCAASACHEDDRPKTHDYRLEAVSRGLHQGLACETCHGPLSEHVQDDKTVGHANLDPNIKLCLSCHQQLVSRPEEYAQFSETLLYHDLLNVSAISSCRACHDPHEPK